MPIQPDFRDARCVNAMTDSERVLDQLARGEIRAGADAARQIAARHQAAYGDAVWGSAEKASS
jgi:hypothetical protein